MEFEIGYKNGSYFYWYDGGMILRSGEGMGDSIIKGMRVFIVECDFWVYGKYCFCRWWYLF